jgi:hypothetical protein
MQNDSMKRSTLPQWKGSLERAEGHTDVGDE